MADENDYNVLVFHLNALAEMVNGMRDEVERRRMQEARDDLGPHETHWVNMLVQRLPIAESTPHHLLDGSWSVLRSRADEVVFPDAEPPAAPDSL